MKARWLTITSSHSPEIRLNTTSVLNGSPFFGGRRTSWLVTSTCSCLELFSRTRQFEMPLRREGAHVLG